MGTGPPTVDRYLTTRQAATLLGLRPATIRDWGARGLLRRYRDRAHPGGYVWAIADLDRAYQLSKTPQPHDRSGRFAARRLDPT